MEYEAEASDQEVDQRAPGQRLWKRTAKHVNKKWTNERIIPKQMAD